MSVSAVECSQIAWQTYLASDEANEDAALENWGRAFEAALATQPMTRVGAIMLIEHVIQIEKWDLPAAHISTCALNSPSVFESALSA